MKRRPRNWIVGCVALCLFGSGPSSATSSPRSAGAIAYVEAIYKAIPTASFDFHRVRYAPELSALMARDAAGLRTGYEGQLDFVPFCDCQDTIADFRIDDVRLVSGGASAASVDVVVHNGKTSTFTIDLIHPRRQWLVADVHSATMASLVAFMRKAVVRTARDAQPPSRSH